MTKKREILKDFRNSIRCGTGKAYLLMKKHPKVNFENEIYKASIKNYAYDGQSEGDRTDYILQFYSNLKIEELDRIKEKLAIRLFEEKEDTWSLQQLFNICGHFAKSDLNVKKAIYRRFKQTPIKDSDWLGTSIILRLDGVNGMIKIAEHFGKRLIKNKDDWQDGWILNSFDESNPKIKIKELLKKESKTNIFIKRYLQEIESTRKRWEKNKNKRTKWTFERTLEHILDDDKRRPMSFVIKKLSKKEIKQIAKLFNKSLSKKSISKLLDIFTFVKYPYSIDDLKEYRKKKYKSEIRDFALEALSLFKDKETRDFAIKKLDKTNNPAKYLDVLKSNYKKGDSSLITKTINRFKDEHIIEQIAISLCELYEKNRTKDCKKPLLALYQKMNCAIHRNMIIKIMYENDILPKSILKELEFDCDEDTREMFRKIKKKAGNKVQNVHSR